MLDIEQERCKCKDWKFSNKEIDKCTMSAFIHGIKYEGEVFKFCPWCGDKLLDVDK